MIKIIWIVLEENESFIGYIVEKAGKTQIYSEETVINESKYNDIKNCYIRREFIEGSLHVFIDLDEDGLSQCLTAKEALEKYGPVQ